MMKSFLRLFPGPGEKRRQQQQEEEGASLVPPPPSRQQQQQQLDHHPHRLCAEDDEDDGRSSETTTSSASWACSSWWWSRGRVLVPTRGVGLLIAGLLILALFVVGATTGSSWWWPTLRLDYYFYSSSSSLVLSGGGGGGGVRQHTRHHAPLAEASLTPIPFSCDGGSTGTSPSPAPAPAAEEGAAGAPSAAAAEEEGGGRGAATSISSRCPEYFRYIHSDLRPWRETGITREAVESGRGRAAFRLVVVGGRAYVETYHRVFQTRDTFTQWGIAQLLARYPGRVPDLDLMFNCEDMPEVRAADFAAAPAQAPPLFRYCKDDATLDIVFPDWSFWGWPEVNIRPWAPLLAEMANETRRLPWPDREPYAFWKGNPSVSPERAELLRCASASSSGVRAFAQDWGAAIRDGFKDSNLAKQCRYRYKVFVRERSWSVSEKYILACDSPMLLVATPFQDFFSRGLVAGRHYWPIDPARMCPSLRLAVDWGNAHPAQARQMASQGSAFAREDLAMDYVYDYMLHLLTEYARLLRYRPTVPDAAVELRPETLACPASARERDFMMESRERYVAPYQPCALPPPFTADELNDMARRDHQVRATVQKMTMEAEKHT